MVSLQSFEKHLFSRRGNQSIPYFEARLSLPSIRDQSSSSLLRTAITCCLLSCSCACQRSLLKDHRQPTTTYCEPTINLLLSNEKLPFPGSTQSRVHNFQFSKKDTPLFLHNETVWVPANHTTHTTTTTTSWVVVRFRAGTCLGDPWKPAIITLSRRMHVCPNGSSSWAKCDAIEPSSYSSTRWYVVFLCFNK